MGEYVKSSGPVDGGTFADAGGIADQALVNQVANAVQFAPSANTRLLPLSSSTGLTAHAGGGQTSALPLPSQVNEVTTVGSANDSVLLPPSQAGLFIVAVNSAAVNSMNVYPQSGDYMNGSQNAAFAVAAGKAALFFCVRAGRWASLLTA